MSDITKLKSSALLSATYDTSLQVFLRLISFFLNAFIVRHVSSSVFAVMTVRLHLLYATGLLLSREAFRRASLGYQSHTEIKKVVNLIWIGAGFSLPLSIVGWVLWCHVMETPPPDITIHYHTSVSLVLVSVIVEVCAESPYIMAELHMWAKVRVAIEGAMQLTRAFLLAVGVYLWPHRAVLVYGISHFIGSFLYCATYYAVFARELKRKETARKLLLGNFRSLFVTFSKGKMLPEVDIGLWRVCVSFLKQGLLKETLTEGELYLMNLFPLISLPQQGVYQVVTNLGSLAARLVFRSVEAASYRFFAQSLQRGILIKDQDKSKMMEVSGFLYALLKNLSLISLFIVTFGWAYSHPLLHLYGGPNLSFAGRGLLRAQCLYVVFMALNGITEAFTFASMSDEQLSRHNYNLVLFSAIYLFVTVAATHFLGAFGFVIGNCVNMMLRIGLSLHYMKRTFEASGSNPLEALSISKRIIATFSFAFIITASSEIFVYRNSFFAHVLVGLATSLSVIILLREDFKEVITGLFSVLDKIYSKTFHDRKAKRKFNCSFLDLIYYYLYKCSL